MRTTGDEAVLAEIREKTRAVLRLAVGEKKRVALLDVPNQRNVGDSLIWEGEVAYLRSLGCEIVHMSDLRGFDPRALRRELPVDGVVLLHGGGNFGDLWAGHQRFREWVVPELRDRKVVQLSQSIFFQDESRAARANKVLAQHPDFTLLIRDSLSMDRAARLLPDLQTVYCHDMALGFEPKARERKQGPEEAQAELLVIARADQEAASGLAAGGEFRSGSGRTRVTDWWADSKPPFPWQVSRVVTQVHEVLSRISRRAARLPFWTPVVGMPNGINSAALRTINRVNVQHGLSLYENAWAVVVDRLHAHVLAVLLGIPNVVLDNNYRKLGAVMDDYTHKFSTANYCQGVDRAHEVLSVLRDPTC